MRRRLGENRGIWLVCGLLFGLGVAYYWPHEPLRADQAERTEKFAVMSIRATTPLGGLASSDAIFILDFLTGRLSGFYMNPNAPEAGFSQMFFRDVANDFQLNEKGAAQPVYAMIGGSGQINGQGVTYGAGVVYVAEMTSGQLVGYAFPFAMANQALPPQQMVPVARTQFRRPFAQ